MEFVNDSTGHVSNIIAITAGSGVYYDRFETKYLFNSHSLHFLEPKN
jgi:hypothetical protein